MRFKMKPTAKAYLTSLDVDTVKRIYQALRDMTQEPPKGDIKQLKGSKKLFRLRIGDYRVTFHYDDNNVIVDRISPRGQAYK